MKLGTRLLRDGVIGLSELEAALRAQVLYGGRLGTNLVELGFLDVDTVGRFLALATGAPEATRDHFERVSASDVARFGAELAEAETAFPLADDINATGAIAVAALDPNDTGKRDRIAAALGRPVVLYTAAEMRLFYYLEKHYGIERLVRYVRSSSPPRQQGRVERRRVQGAPRVVIEPRRRSSARAAAAAESAAAGDTPEANDAAAQKTPAIADVGEEPTDPLAESFAGDEVDPDAETGVDALATTLADAHAHTPAPGVPALATTTREDDDDDDGDAETEADAHGRTLAGAHPYQPRPPAPERGGAGGEVDVDADTQADAHAATAPAAIAPPGAPGPRPRDSNEISRVIDSAEHRETIAEALVSFAPGRVDALAILLIRDRTAMGWRAYAPNGRVADVDQLSVPLTELSTLKLAYDANETYWGPPPDRSGAGETRLWSTLGITPVPERILIVPISVRDRVVNLIAATAEELGGVTRGQLNSLANAASEAYLRMIRSFRSKS